jgi:thioredoxin-like negative regulator of GroEL
MQQKLCFQLNHGNLLERVNEMKMMLLKTRLISCPVVIQNSTKFVEDSKLKIKKYYAANKGAIISKANKLAATGDYEAAIALLSNYPTQAVGSNEAQITLRKIYSKYQSVNSGKILQQARAAFASNDYESAAALASQIGPDSNRYGEAKLLINKIRNTVEKEKNAANNRAMRALQISADVEKNRTNAIASIARAYYGRHIINYNVIHL